LLATVGVISVIVALALPRVTTTLRDYRLHSDGTEIATYLNVARMKAASQYAPYRLNIQDPTQGLGTYSLEKLCGDTASSVDSNCTSAYNPFTTRQIDQGTQYLNTGDTFSSCRPAGVTAFPLSAVTSNPSGCPTLLQFYFNTRGSPVDSSGNILTNGGNVVYIQNQSNLIDAVTVSLGGNVAVWTWSPGQSTWTLR
jgi:Tfp pilus assembly protein FimT